MTEGDIPALEQLLADDLIYTHTDARVQTKAEFIRSLRTGELRYVSIEPENTEVRLYGTTAVVTGRAAMKVRSEGRESSFQIRFIDVYVRRKGQWQMVAWQSTRLPQ